MKDAVARRPFLNVERPRGVFDALYRWPNLHMCRVP